MTYQKYTTAEIQEAKDVDMVELLSRLNYSVKHHYKEDYKIEGYGGLYVSHRKGWYWHKEAGGGNAVDFFMKHPDFHLTFIQAVTLIRETMGLGRGLEDVQTQIQLSRYKTEIKEAPKQFKLPRRYKNNERVITYLTKVRCLDEKIVRRLIEV